MIVAVILAGALVIALAAWELLVCEGAHLGPRFVVWLYDLAAGRYEAIKSFDPDWERRTVGEALHASVGSLAAARVLDVGAGTGRVPRALLAAGDFSGKLVCLEPSRRMLARGSELARHQNVSWVRAWAIPLPFPDDAFDIVVSLEVLEFTPCPSDTLAEMIRVLRPGGWMLVTNRVGRSGRWILGRTMRPQEFAPWLERAGLESIDVVPWQVEYDLAWARKPWPTSDPVKGE